MRCARPPARADSTEQLRKALYVEHQMGGIIASKQYGRIALLSILNDRYNETNGRLTPAQVLEMQTLANTRSDGLKEFSDVADSALNYKFYPGTRETAKSLLKIAGALSGEMGKKVTTILEELTNLGGRAAEYNLGTGAQREAQERRLMQISYLQRYGRDTLAEALDHARIDTPL